MAYKQNKTFEDQLRRPPAPPAQPVGAAPPVRPPVSPTTQGTQTPVGVAPPPQVQAQPVSQPVLFSQERDPLPGQAPPEGSPQPPVAPPVAPPGQAPGKPAGVSDRAWKSFNEINSNISLEQWQAWDQYADASCPENNPYRSQKVYSSGQKVNTCEESPDNCPPGYQAWGPTQCRQTGVEAGVGGGGGQGGAGGAGWTGGTGVDPGIPGGVDSEVWKAILARLGQSSRYSPEIMASLLGQLKTGAEGAAKTQEEEYNANLASRGLARSAVANEGYRQIRAGVSNQVMGGRNEILRAKVDADFADQSAAIDEGNEYLNSLRQYVASMNATQAQKEAHLAEINLGYAQLAQQLQVLREQYAQEMARLGLGL